ncbi:MAG: hypothetical protein ACT6FF_08010 [Methanosarcinaceae archaeon]
MKTLIVCGSRYGSTRVIAQWIAERLGFVRIPPLQAGLLHGEINPSRLTANDKKRLMLFYNKILKQDYATVPYRTKMNKEEVWRFKEGEMIVAQKRWRRKQRRKKREKKWNLRA